MDEPVRWAGSPTCSPQAFPQGSNWCADKGREIIGISYGEKGKHLYQHLLAIVIS
jgi:hypothetical protein